MQRVQKIEIFNGLIFNNTKEAKKHLDKIYGDIILKLGRELCVKNYSESTEYIDENLHMFVQLDKIKKDMILEKEEDE